MDSVPSRSADWHHSPNDSAGKGSPRWSSTTANGAARRGSSPATNSTCHANARTTAPRSGGPRPNRTSTNTESSCGAPHLPACTPPRWPPPITASPERSPNARWLTVSPVHAWCAPAVPLRYSPSRSSIASDHSLAARRSICRSMWRPENGASPTHQMHCSARKSCTRASRSTGTTGWRHDHC